MAAAVEAVAPGRRPEAVAAAAMAIAGAEGIVVSRAEVSGRRRDGLAKAALVAIRVAGRTPGGPFAIARTTVAGFDTLEADVVLATHLLGVLVRAIAAARPGATGDEVRDAARGASPGQGAAGQGAPGKAGPGLPLEATASRAAVAILGTPRVPGSGRAVPRPRQAVEFTAMASGTPLEEGQVIYVEADVTAPSGPAGRRVILGDMLRVTPTGGSPLTRLACRLWL